MIVAIDETGDFSPKSNFYHFMSAVHLQNTNGKYDLVYERFNEWENSLPKSLKNHKGEIKSSILNEEQLNSFIDKVLFREPIIIISTIRFNPTENPYQIVNKHKFMLQVGINEGITLFTKLKRPHIVKIVRDFSFWFRKLSYTQFIKIELLGNIIYKSFRNTIGSSIAWNLDKELLDLKFIIDEMFLKGKQQNAFWHELLRNQFYAESVKDPLPFLDKWEETGHPFVNKYLNKEGVLDFNDLFWNNCEFKKSHNTFEIRIADTVNTILSNYYNFNTCNVHFEKLNKVIMPKGRIYHIILNDFDVEKAIGKNPFNPWENKEQFKIRMSNIAKK
ncbi:MAG: hypothetical protein STSR0008_25360 [Ignavibacterium sp.]